MNPPPKNIYMPQDNTPHPEDFGVLNVCLPAMGGVLGSEELENAALQIDAIERRLVLIRQNLKRTEVMESIVLIEDFFEAHPSLQSLQASVSFHAGIDTEISGQVDWVDLDEGASKKDVARVKDRAGELLAALAEKKRAASFVSQLFNCEPLGRHTLEKHFKIAMVFAMSGHTLAENRAEFEKGRLTRTLPQSPSRATGGPRL
jgi:hypothetical protein